MNKSIKKIISIMLIGILSIIALAYFVPLFFHEQWYIYSHSFFSPFPIIEMKKDIKDEVSNDYETHWDTILYCVKFDLQQGNLSKNELDLPISEKEREWILKKIKIVDRITDENGDNYYKLELRTFFNIKYREDVITKKIDPMLINRGCR